MMNGTLKDRIRQVANVVTFIAAVGFNSVPRATGREVGEVSRETEPLLAAAGYTFSIWAVLFAAQLAYAVFQALPSQRANPILRRIGWFTVVVALGELTWNAFFTTRHFAMAWLMILINLTALITIELRLGNDARHGRELWLVRVPFAATFGWISVATLLNTAQVSSPVLGWNADAITQMAWSLFLVFAGIVAGVTVALVRRNLVYAAVVAWGLCGVAVEKRLDAPMLASFAGAGAALLISLVLIEGFAMWRGYISLEVQRSPRGVA